MRLKGLLSEPGPTFDLSLDEKVSARVKESGSLLHHIPKVTSLQNILLHYLRSLV